MSYSQALEEQVRLLRFMESADFRDFERQEFADKDSLGLASDSLTARQYDVMRSALEVADPYYWAPQMVRLADDAAGSLPDFPLSPDLLPTRAGFWWFSAVPGLTMDFHGIAMVCRGVVWLAQAAGIYVWFAYEVPGSANLFPGNLVYWKFGQSAEDVVGLAIRRFPEIAALAEADRTGEATLRAEKTMAHMRLFCAALLFMRQHILMTSQHRAERHVRKRVEREGFQYEPLVRVVELRRKHVRSEHHGDTDPVEWSHQWIVSGHWRQQWYPSLNANQPRWIMPYVKGPEDKPLKPPRAKVFAVVR